MKSRLEILAPAGTYDSLKAAIAAGADAVYAGGSRFGARAYAGNFEEEELLKAIDYVHLHGRKLYLTVNTLLKERELAGELYDYLLPYYRQGVDAVIVQDAGVLSFVRKHFPDLPVHASTQMTITNVSGAKFLESLGVERVVTAREMSLAEIREIADQTKLEIESFVHGALCYCYSGQCLYSSLIGGRSGNRGQCAQPCRLPYTVKGKTSYVLSPKDMCALDLIPDLAGAGIDSFKIEGRMKKPEYVAAVTAVYRKYADRYLEYGREGFRVSEEDRAILMDLYNRGGFHEGYYKTRNGREMLSLKRPNHAGIPAVKVTGKKGKEISGKALRDLHKGDVIELAEKENFTLGKDVRCGEMVTIPSKDKRSLQKGTVLNRTRNEKLLKSLKEEFTERKIKEKINGKLILSPGNPVKLEVSAGEFSFTAKGGCAEEAKNQPASELLIEKQMRKTGNTEFEFGSLDIQMEGNLFVPVQVLNEVRRAALQGLAGQITGSAGRQNNREVCAAVSDEETRSREPERAGAGEGFAVCVEQKEQFQAALGQKAVTRIYVDCGLIRNAWNSPENEALVQEAKNAGKEIYFAMPYIFRKDTKNLYKRFFENFAYDGVLVRNYESLWFVRECAPQTRIVLDANLYQFNREAKSFFRERNAERLTAPLELNCRELGELGISDSELIVYGYLQMMVSAQCVKKTTEGCTKDYPMLMMKDRYQKEFAIRSCCDYCYNVIYNTEPLCLADQKEEIRALHPAALRLNFTRESRKETAEILDFFEKVFSGEEKAEMPLGSFTRGHFRRGIK